MSMEIPHISTQAEDEVAEARIDEMSTDELRNELATNQSARDHLSREEQELVDTLMLNRSTQTKLRRRGQAIIRRLEEMDELGDALPIIQSGDLE